ncbi:hypothetical protein [Jiella avicenniae]|uniref:Uncharacterized protein n=1 Tax=Jiella avicenniae TaxID=2907202 RepID=A0A9X1P199_9HYPH|nr:hypothetical protein [Jiella avicenniae]MCE7029550.1 hypothetical protein [Jiella avicenniae]
MFDESKAPDEAKLEYTGGRLVANSSAVALAAGAAATAATGILSAGVVATLAGGLIGYLLLNRIPKTGRTGSVGEDEQI